jgi:tetratricopeptide (TPR) repeat protein
VTRRCLAFLFWLCLTTSVWAQKPAKPPEPVEPPEEDESLTAKEYVFNPLQAEKEIKAGEFYAKKGNQKAAATRFREATKWDPTSANAFMRLAETLEKMKDTEGASKAYQKVVELDGDGKLGERARKKLPPKT